MKAFLVGIILLSCFGLSQRVAAQTQGAATYANPMDLSYRFQLSGASRREAADPTMAVFRGEYWLFASKSGGYWHSKDLQNWKFVAPTGLPIEDYAPTVVAMNDHLYFTAFNSKGIWSTDDPAKGTWTKEAEIGAYPDPALFLDDDGKLYIYSGCSNKAPLMATELDPKNGFRVVRSEPIDASRDTANRGFEVPGDNNEITADAPWIEGAWMTKHDGKYYLQYAAPGTQFNTYADGVLIGDSPMGPFHAPPYNPFSIKPSGFMAGAGHGSTFQDLQGKWWHIATMTISVRHMFERRLGLFPVRFLADGQMLEDTYLADYPHRWKGDRGLAGWMLLSYEKPVTASSSLEKHEPGKAVNENARDWWSAKTGDAGEWLTVDLKAVQKVTAVQINFSDEGSTAMGASTAPYLYSLEGSADGRLWKVLVDHRKSGRDSSQDYEELPAPASIRYVRITNEKMPNAARFSLSGLRVFGIAHDARPGKVSGLTVVRSSKEPADGRIAEVSWKTVPGAEFYIIRYGVSRDRLFSSYQVYHATSREIRSLNAGVSYFFSVDAVNSAGTTKGTDVVELQK